MPVQQPVSAEPSGSGVPDQTAAAPYAVDPRFRAVQQDAQRAVLFAQQEAQQAPEQRPRPRTIAPELIAPPRDYVDTPYAGELRSPDAPVQSATSRKGRSPAPRDEPDTFEDTPPRSRLASAGRWIKRVAVLIFFASTLSAAAWYAYPHRADLLRMATALTGDSATSASPFGGFGANPESSDLALQKVPLWRVLKRDYPDWYKARINDAAELTRTKQPDTVITQRTAEELAKLRRQYAGDALSATAPQLQAIAASFSESLIRLRKHSVDACYTFISAGEANPQIVPLLQMPDIAELVHKQWLAVFNAVAEGRKQPRVYPPPKQGDYDVLVKELQARGWTQGDMQLFSDSRALAKATPEKVCTLVTQWFESQMMIKDPDAKLRLLVDSLRPVVAG
jgi:hypothetical protein